MEITLFLLRNFGLKHVTLVTDLRCFEKPGPGFIFQDDNARPHRTRIVENFNERKVVMTTHITG